VRIEGAAGPGKSPETYSSGNRPRRREYLAGSLRKIRGRTKEKMMNAQSPLNAISPARFFHSPALSLANAGKALLLLLLAATSTLAFALPPNSGKSGNQYVNGAEGVKGPTIPPPGTYLRWYNYNYDANTIKDANGNPLPDDLNVKVIASIPRLIWVSPQKPLKGNMVASVLIPITYGDVRVGVANYDQHATHLGDLQFTTLLAWHGKRYDLAGGSDWFLPTGAWNATSHVKLGSDEYTIMPDLGVTYYLDSQRKWNASVLARFEYHTEKLDQNIHMGDDFHFEWAAARALGKKGVELGATGYAQWKVTDDTGTGVTWAGTDHDRVFSAGPELDAPLPGTKIHMQMRGEIEFGARSRTEGEAICVILTRRF
jgi:hypothetical protein